MEDPPPATPGVQTIPPTGAANNEAKPTDQTIDEPSSPPDPETIPPTEASMTTKPADPTEAQPAATPEVTPGPRTEFEDAIADWQAMYQHARTDLENLNLEAMIARVATTNLTRVCIVCNNLRPDGHEDNFANPRGGFKDMRRDARLVAARTEAGQRARALTLAGIKVREIKDAKNGTPHHGRTRFACQFCAFLWEVLVEFFGEDGLDRYAHRPPDDDRRDIKLMIREGAPLVIGCTRFISHPDWNFMRLDIELFTDPPPSSSSSAAEEENVEVVADPQLVFIGPAVEKAKRSDDEQAFGFVRECYATCREEHELCKSSEGSFRAPMRLMFLGQSDDEIKLVETADFEERVPWVALSHCWGKADILRLTKDNHEKLRTKLPYDEMPNTFKNAVAVTRMLKLEYLWIDSLCIVQDSTEDWEENAAAMGQVYSHAAIVISAAMSSSTWVEFLGERNEDYWGSRKFEFPVAIGQTRTVKARRRHVLASPLEQGGNEPPYTMSWATLIRDGMLFRRAWAFQEALLAPRIVHFESGGLVFECKTHRRIEGMLPPYASTIEGSLGFYSETEKWRLAVKSYSRRKLTFPKDRLTALSGVAQAFAERGQRGEYYAGLWSDSLVDDLVWQLMPGSQHIATTFPAYVSPTWSWASVNFGVVWGTYEEAEPLLTVQHVICNLKTSNPFGEVGAVILLVSGHLLPCRVRYDRGAAEYHASFRTSAEGEPECWSPEVWFTADGLLTAGKQKTTPQGSYNLCRRASQGEAGQGDQILHAWFLPVLKTSEWSFDYIGLIISESPQDVTSVTVYNRLGLMSCVPGTWFDASKPASVVLF